MSESTRWAVFRDGVQIAVCPTKEGAEFVALFEDWKDPDTFRLPRVRYEIREIEQ